MELLVPSHEEKIKGSLSNEAGVHPVKKYTLMRVNWE